MNNSKPVNFSNIHKYLDSKSENTKSNEFLNIYETNSEEILYNEVFNNSKQIQSLLIYHELIRNIYVFYLLESEKYEDLYNNNENNTPIGNDNKYLSEIEFYTNIFYYLSEISSHNLISVVKKCLNKEDISIQKLDKSS